MNQIPEHLQKELQHAWGHRDGLLMANQFDPHDSSEDDTFILRETPGEASNSSSSSEAGDGRGVLE